MSMRARVQIPITHIESQVQWQKPIILVCRGGDRRILGTHWPASLVGRVSFRSREKSVSKNDVESDMGILLTLTSRLHVHIRICMWAHIHEHMHTDSLQYNHQIIDLLIYLALGKILVEYCADKGLFEVSNS